MVECQLPKLDVAGSNPVSRSKINNLRTLEKHTLHSPPLSIRRTSFDRDHIRENGFLELFRGDRPILDAGFRVDIERHSNAVPALVCRYLRVHFGLVAEARVGPPHDLEVHPAQADRFQLRS